MKRVRHKRWSKTRWALLCICIFGGYLRAQESHDALVQQLNRALESNDGAEVQALGQKLLSGDVSAGTLLAAGIVMAQHDRLDDAAALFERCSERDPESFEAKYNLVLARIGLKQFPAALGVLNSIPTRNTDQKAAVDYLTGKVFLETNHLAEAQKLLAGAYAHSPREENYALDLGLLYIRSGSYVPAIDVLEPALRLHPASEELAVELALADVLANRYSDGISLCRRLQHDGSESALPTLIIAFSECSQKDYQACESESSAGLASAHPHPYLYYLRARALWESGSADRNRALNDASKAIEQMPQCSACLLLRSRIFEAVHEEGSAIADLKKVVGLDPQAGSAWYRLSVLYRKAGLEKQASDALQHYRVLHDDETSQQIESFRRQVTENH